MKFYQLGQTWFEGTGLEEAKYINSKDSQVIINDHKKTVVKENANSSVFVNSLYR